MKPQLSYLLSIITMTFLQTYAMNELSELNIFHKKTNYLSFPTYERQINLPNDILDKIIAPYSYSTRCQLRRVCKQFYCLNHINRLDKFMIHHLSLGDYEERSAFFKDIIKSNNPDLIPFVLSFAQKNAEKFHPTKNDNTIITFDKTIPDNDQEIFIQQYFIKPLLKEGARQNNKIMISAIIEQGGDPEVVTIYRYNFYRNIAQCMLIGICTLTIVIGAPIAIVFTSNITNSNP